MARTRKTAGTATTTEATGTEAAVVKERRARTTFDPKTAVGPDGESIANEEGKLTSVPSNFDPKNHKPLKKAIFVDEATYLDYRAWDEARKADRFLKKSARMTARAERLRKFGDDKMRKKADRAARMREQLKTLEAEMTEAGVDLDDVFGAEDELNEAAE